MLNRRGARALVASAVVIGAFALVASGLPPTFATAASPTPANDNARTLIVSLPGPFNGCGYLDPGASPTTNAILDLTQPSAFVTGLNGTLIGEGGAIATAELTSLQPETVRYTIAPQQRWSSGAVFNGADLVRWWQRAKVLASVVSDGYRAIKSLAVSSHGLVVTAVFAHPFADWNVLFRDVQIVGATKGCDITNLLRRPSLGPYRVTEATRSRVVLSMNSRWSLDGGRFGRVVITQSTTLPAKPTALYAAFTPTVTSAQLQVVSTRPTLSSRISSSNAIEELTFSPKSIWTAMLAVRRALSWSIDRQILIDRLFSAETFSTSIAASAIFSQGQSEYPGPSGSGPTDQTTTTVVGTPANGLNDCRSCAIDVLEQRGFRRTSRGWVGLNHRLLSIRLGVGPSSLDHSVAKFVVHSWENVGVRTRLTNERTDAVAANAAATNAVDVSIFARPTSTTPSYAARSWAGPPYPDTYPSGVRLASVARLFRQASAVFNPVTAAATWLSLDQIIMSDYWVRPLFTAPSFLVWSSNLVTVENGFSVEGLVDQIPSWSLAIPAPSSS